MLLFATAFAASTPEEEALAAALAGRHADAVAALTRAGQPETDQAAALYALRARLFGPAARLIPANGPPWTSWARVDLLAGQGDLQGAARLALAQMDAALAGEHRAALLEMMVGWAKDPGQGAGPGALLQAAIAIGGGKAAEDALLALPVPNPDRVAVELAAARRAAGDTSPDVARILGLRTALLDGERAFPLLVEALAGERSGALLAADKLNTLRIHPEETARALALFAARFPGDAEVAKRRLAHATATVEGDPARGLRELDSLADDPVIGGDARVLAATKEPDPARRGARWRAIGERTPGSALARRAAEEALSALRAEVAAIEDPTARRARATAALAEPGAALDTALLYAAAPAEGRAAALRSLASRFPKGPWCAEWAELEVRAGAEPATARAWDKACDARDAWGQALTALASEDPWLTLVPVEGGVDAIVTGVATLSVAQHVVRAEELFASGETSPLDTPLDAFLVTPTRTWSVPAESERAAIVHIPARGSEPLTALTVRGGDLRGTVLATREALDVVGVHVGKELAIGVTRGETPVPGADLRLLIEGGEVRTARTGADGIARVEDVEGAVRVMAARGRGLGFGAFSADDGSPAENARVELVIGESGIEAGGTYGHVSVFAPTRDGARAPEALTLASTDAAGTVIEVTRVTLVDGAASARLWLAPGGSVEAREGTFVRAITRLPVAAPTDGPIAFSVSGDLRDTLSVDVWPRVAVPPEGLSVALDVATPWGQTHRDVWVEAGGRVTTAVPLVAAAAGERITVSARVPGHPAVSVTLQVATAASRPPRASPREAVTTGSGLAVLHRDQIERAWFVRAGEDLAESVAPAESEGWVVTSGAGGPFRIPARPPPEIGVKGMLRRGQAANLVFTDLPAGSRVWAWVTDASDFSRAPPGIGLPAGWAGGPGAANAAQVRTWVDGETIAAGLLAEEERQREAAAPTRLDYGFSAAAEEVRGIGGGIGHGSGGSASGVGGLGTTGRGSGSIGRTSASPAVDPGLLAALDGAATTEWAVTVPPWVTRAWVRALARTPDGRWAGVRVAVPVEGGPVTPYEARPVVASSDPLLTLALGLPREGRAVALAGLVRAGTPAARPALLALEPRGIQGRGLVLAGRMVGEAWVPFVDSPALPDPRLAERARQALTLAPGAPERALAAARRLLGAPLPDAVRADAGLALWAAKAPEAEVRAALAGDGPQTALARAIALRPDPADAGLYRQIADNPHAAAVTRGIAIAALAGLPVAQRAVSRPTPAAAPERLTVLAEPPRASWHGEVFARGAGPPVGSVPVRLESVASVAAGEVVQLRVEVPGRTTYSRLECPERTFELAPSGETRTFECPVIATAPGRWPVREYSEQGVLLAEGVAALDVREGPRALTGATPLERYHLGLAILGERPAEGRALLEGLLREEGLSSDAVATITERLLEATIAEKRDAATLTAAFDRYRELVPGGELSLPAAAAVAHAFAEKGEHTRAIAATHVVMDARFREELAAVNVIRSAGLDLTALKLLRELTFRYPETPSVVQARAAAPTLLLTRADGDGDRLGYTRSSLRHTAAAELARFLALHPADASAPQSAALLLDTLARLEDTSRIRRLAPSLARRYADTPVAWRLALAETQGALAVGDAAAALRRLDGLYAPEGKARIALQRGRALEALGRWEDAEEAYLASGTSEASARRAWLVRRGLSLPPLLVDASVVPAELRAGTTARISATPLELESLLLRDDGQLDLARVRLDGLPVRLEQRVTIGHSGDLPLPRLDRGAWLVTVEVDGVFARTVLLAGALEVRVQPGGGGTLVEVRGPDGKPAVDASIWVFQGGEVEALRTDLAGRAWAATPVTAVLARASGAYGWRDLADPAVPVPPEAPPGQEPPPVYTEDTYGALFEGAEIVEVRANAL